MKLLLLIIISFISTNLIKNANSVGEGGQGPKLYKSFDEIFGKGWDDESNESKDLKCRHVKEEVQDGQAPNTSDQKNIDEILKQKFDEIYDENWSEDEDNSAPSQDDLDQENSIKHLSDQNNSTDQDKSVDEQQNESNKCEKIESDQQKREIIQKFRVIKDNYQEKNKRPHSAKEWNQIEIKISNGLGVSRTKLYKWMKEFGLSRKTKFKSMFSELEQREILKHFDKIKSKCQKAKLKNSKNKLDNKIANKLGFCASTIYEWKRKFGLTNSNKSDATKIGILKKYAKIKGKNPKMTDAVIAVMLKISTGSLSTWKRQFKDELRTFKNIRTL
ncbi:hypothetical protein GPALN_012343 [Globodera pallida]|nr:hypothetical protein GPALN_012343 [Globodera pallida]